ncbi:MAG: hypothetical protein IT377_12310 [Polyangiaceae bacterium]|nr:hypothetical protein [Polyangiaceae bacterium]
MELFEPAAMILLVVFGLVQLGAALAAAGLPRRVLGLPQKKVAELAEGGARVHGQLLAISGAPTALDGSTVLATETRLLGAQTWASVRSAELWAEAAVSDDGGQCSVDLDGVVLLSSEVLRAALEPERLRAICPALWDKMTEAERRRPMLQIEQRVVRLGSGVVAGEVAPGRRSAGEGYREAPRERLALQCGVGTPLVVAAQPRGAVARHLFGPAALHALVAVLAFALAFVVFAVDRWIAVVAGVPAVFP